MEINNNDLQPRSHDNEPPSDGIMGDKADAGCVSMNVATDENSNKKRRSNRKKKDNAEGLGGNEIHAMDVGNGGVNGNMKTTDNAEEVFGGNEIHVPGGNGGIDAPMDFLGSFNDEELDGSNEGSADDHFVHDTSATVIDSKDVLRKMIQLLSKEGMSDNPPVNLLCNLVPYEEYLLQIAGQVDNKMSYVDERMSDNDAMTW